MTELAPVPSRLPGGHPRRDQLREERLEILRMVEGGIVTVDEASGLLEALDRAERQLAAPPEAQLPAGGRARQVRIRITEDGRNRPTVNAAFPLGLLDAGMKIARQWAPHMLPNAEEVKESIATGFRGHLLDVDDGEQRVEIIVE